MSSVTDARSSAVFLTELEAELFGLGASGGGFLRATGGVFLMVGKRERKEWKERREEEGEREREREREEERKKGGKYHESIQEGREVR